jgi:hypothetical protein
MEVWNIRKLEV